MRSQILVDERYHETFIVGHHILLIDVHAGLHVYQQTFGKRFLSKFTEKYKSNTFLLILATGMEVKDKIKVS